MHNVSQRAKLLVGLGVLAIPLAVAATAYACTSVATLTDSPGAGVAGSTVTVTGAFYGVHDPADATTAGPVEIRLGSLTAPVLATATPSGPSGSFTVQVTIPKDAAAGDTFLAATQANPDGTAVYGTPARQAFTVLAPPAPTPPLFAPVTFTPPATTAAACVVPRVKGKSAAVAKRMLGAAHCGVGKVTKVNAKSRRRSRLVVASTGLKAGTTAANGTKVDLRLRWI